MIVPDKHMIYLSKLRVLLVDQLRHRPRMRSTMSVCGYSLVAVAVAVSVTKLLFKVTTSWRGSGQKLHRIIQLTCVDADSRRVRFALCLKMVGIIAVFMYQSSTHSYVVTVPLFHHAVTGKFVPVPATGYWLPAALLSIVKTVLHSPLDNSTVSRQN